MTGLIKEKIPASWKHQKVVVLMVFFLSCITLHLNAQIIVPKNTIYLFGQITNSLNGGPIKNQSLTVYSDSLYYPGFTYTKVLKTDEEGYFYDTITTCLNKGALQVFTYDYLQGYHDTTIYFRFNWSEENYLFANFILPAEPPAVIYQANFYYLKNPTGQNFAEFQFFDITNSTDIIWREWNFGDGHYSNEVNPIHEYTEQGIFKVKLIVGIQPTPYSIPYYTEIVKIINVSIKSYFNLGGHVKAGYFPIDAGEAYLFKIENSDIIIIDTAVFNDTLGYYYFYQLIEGEYLVRADLRPESIYFNQFMNTYYADKSVWTEADTIFHYADNFEYDILMIPIASMNPGPGKISGIISYGYDPDNEKGMPAGNVEILLFNNDNEPVICSHSAGDGTFSFDNLELGNYSVHAEVTGKFTFPVQISLTLENQMVNGVNIIIGNYTINGSVNWNTIDESSVAGEISNIYPNPAADHLYIDLLLNNPGDLEIMIVDYTGKIVLTSPQPTTPGMNTCFLDISTLSSGMYFIKVGRNSEFLTGKFIKR
jgi:hypothetical protein